MKQKYRLYRRNLNGNYYIQDNVTGKQQSLGTRDKTEAHRLLHTRNEAASQPAMNLQIARAYLSAGDPKVTCRTWQDVMDETTKNKTGLTQKRWESLMRNHALDELRKLRLMETRFDLVMQSAVWFSKVQFRLAVTGKNRSFYPFSNIAKKTLKA